MRFGTFSLILLLMVPAWSAQANTATCKGGATVNGTLTSEKGKIKFNNTPVEVRANHCIDVDRRDQGGCISTYRIKTKGQKGCGLQLTLLRHPIDDIFEVRSLQFVTDSYCRGWFDAAEGLYQADAAEFTVRAPKQVNKGQETRRLACFNGKIKVKGSADFRRPGRSEKLDGSFSFQVNGMVQSTGAVNQPCLRDKPKVAKTKRKRIQKPRPKPRQRVLAKTPINFRLDFGLGLSSFDGFVSSRASLGQRFTLILAAAPETYVGLGLGVVIGDERIELHPRIVGLSHARYSDLSEGAVNMGVTARLLLSEKFGLHLDASTSMVASTSRGFTHASLGLSWRF